MTAKAPRPKVARRKPSRRTSTSAFGSPGRTSHDSSSFYAGRMYTPPASGPGPAAEQTVPETLLDHVVCRSSERMTALPDRSVHLMVTSPPYNAGKEYDQDLTLDEYRELLRRVFSETYRVLVAGGRACINLANLGRKPYIPLHVFVVQDLLEIGFLMRGEIIWNKAGSASPVDGLGLMAIGRQPGAARHSRVHPGIQQGVLRPERQGAREQSGPGRVPRMDQERVDLPGRLRPPDRPPGAVPGGAAPTTDRAVHIPR